MENSDENGLKDSGRMRNSPIPVPSTWYDTQGLGKMLSELCET
jgi:hypothetical protein